MNLEDRTNKLEQEVKSLKSSQFLGGDSYAIEEEVISFTMSREGDSSLGWVSNKIIGLKQKSGGAFGIMQFSKVDITRSDGLVLSGWGGFSVVPGTQNYAQRCSSGEYVHMLTWQNSDPNEFVFWLETPNTAYTYNVKLTIRKNVDGEIRVSA